MELGGGKHPEESGIGLDFMFGKKSDNGSRQLLSWNARLRSMGRRIMIASNPESQPTDAVTDLRLLGNATAITYDN